MPVLTLRVHSLVRATPDTRILKLHLDGAEFPFRAGQAVMLGAHGQPLKKPYSIASAPEEAQRLGRLEFLIRGDAAGGAGGHLAGTSRGSQVDVDGPFGRFHFPDRLRERHFLFIAGGTGIAPLRSMLWHALLTGARARIGVLYSARSPRDFAYSPELRRLAREGKIQLTLTATRAAGGAWRGERGRINQARLASHVSSPATLCFVCGPPSMVIEVPPILRQLGVPSTRIRVEEW